MQRWLSLAQILGFVAAAAVVVAVSIAAMVRQESSDSRAGHSRFALVGAAAAQAPEVRAPDPRPEAGERDSKDRARAENHAKHHPTYVNWKNQKGSGCCNDQDCGEVEDRLGDDGTTEVKVEGRWCPVEPWMLLKTGKSPNWTTAHACVLALTGYEFDVSGADEILSPCRRLICFAGKPGS